MNSDYKNLENGNKSAIEMSNFNKNSHDSDDNSSIIDNDDYKSQPKNFFHKMGMKALTNIKDGLYIDERSNFVWVKYEMPFYILFSSFLTIMFIISITTVMNK